MINQDIAKNAKVTKFRREILIELKPNAFELVSNWRGLSLKFTLSTEAALQLAEQLSEQKEEEYERLHT